MTNQHGYDGTGKLSEAIAALYGYSPKNHNKTAELVKPAKDALGVTCHPKYLPNDVKLAIYRWHVDRRNAATAMQTDIMGETLDDTPLTAGEPEPNGLQPESEAPAPIADTPAFSESDESHRTTDTADTGTGSNGHEPALEPIPDTTSEATATAVDVQALPDPADPEALPPIAIVQDVKQDIPAPLTNGDSQPVEALPTEPPSPVEIISHDETVELYSQGKGDGTVETFSQYGINDLVRVAFYTVGNGVKKRQVIALDGFYINALILATGIGKADVPKWVQAAVDNWEAFDPGLPITKQVKCLIVQELACAIRR